MYSTHEQPRCINTTSQHSPGCRLPPPPRGAPQPSRTAGRGWRFRDRVLRRCWPGDKGRGERRGARDGRMRSRLALDTGRSACHVKAGGGWGLPLTSSPCRGRAGRQADAFVLSELGFAHQSLGDDVDPSDTSDAAAARR